VNCNSIIFLIVAFIFSCECEKGNEPSTGSLGGGTETLCFALGQLWRQTLYYRESWEGAQLPTMNYISHNILTEAGMRKIIN
jgi:hypothetical protein